MSSLLTFMLCFFETTFPSSGPSLGILPLDTSLALIRSLVPDTGLAACRLPPLWILVDGLTYHCLTRPPPLILSWNLLLAMLKPSFCGLIGSFWICLWMYTILLYPEKHKPFSFLPFANSVSQFRPATFHKFLVLAAFLAFPTYSRKRFQVVALVQTKA